MIILHIATVTTVSRLLYSRLYCMYAQNSRNMNWITKPYTMKINLIPSSSYTCMYVKVVILLFIYYIYMKLKFTIYKELTHER